jgi:MerR family transcriptional regulator, light-induced transcriptional regulator
MEHIKQNFSIKDLENLSGIKAHTIRIWEKRYDILTPDRTETNIRTYNIRNLQKLLNVSFLNDHGYKISRIAKLEDPEIGDMVKKVAASASEQNRSINSFKISMINFDQKLFNDTYNGLLEKNSFREIFLNIFIPLLDEIGLLWQTDTINPVHEHFLTGLIKQKLYLNIAKLDESNGYEHSELYVLFLPHNEIHDLGLLYLNFELNYHRKKTIFLGPSMPMNDMRYLLEVHPNIKFVSYLTTTPSQYDEFIKEFNSNLCEDKNRELHLLGRKIQPIDPLSQAEHIKIYKSIPEFITELNV